MSKHSSHEVGALLLRVALGSVFLAHSVYLKLVIFGLPGTAQFFASIGLPGFLAYAVFAAEAVGGIALIAGIHTRVVALALVPIALGATWAHLGAGWLFTNEGGGWEYPLFLSAALMVQYFVGDGVLSLGSRHRAGTAPRPAPPSQVRPSPVS